MEKKPGCCTGRAQRESSLLGLLDAKFFKKSAETEKNSKEKQNAKHKKGTFLNWFDITARVILTLREPTFSIKDRPRAGLAQG